MVLIDACVRLIPGVMGKEASGTEESFSSHLVEYPQFTRPQVWEGRPIPDVLTSGDHGKVDAWRRLEAERPDPGAAAGPLGGLSGRSGIPPRKAGRKGDKAVTLSYRRPEERPADLIGRCRRRYPMNVIQQLEKEQMAKLSAGKEIPDFGPGDTVVVNVKVVEGERTRVQAYEGVCIGRVGERPPEQASRCARFPTAKAWSACFRSGRRWSSRSRWCVAARSPRQAVLPARSPRQVGPYRRTPDRPTEATEAATRVG